MHKLKLKRGKRKSSIFMCVFQQSEFLVEITYKFNIISILVSKLIIWRQDKVFSIDYFSYNFFDFD